MRRYWKSYCFAALSCPAVFLCWWGLGSRRVDAQESGGVPQRPPIVGVAHIGLKTSSIDKADQFYGHILGYDHFSLDKPTGGLMLNYYKVNDHQYIEIYPTLSNLSDDRMTHYAFETTDMRRLRDYLEAKGVKVPKTLKPGLDKNLSMMVKDPEGHDVEFVQYMPGSLHSSKFGKLLPSTRISQRMIHVGVTVKDRAKEDGFYKDILGFKLKWEGGMTDGKTDWVDMQVPNGTDWLEYMLVNQRQLTPKQLGVLHHFALGVPDIQVADKTVQSRDDQPIGQPKIGRDGKWQLNLYDPNKTRAELMEFKQARPACCSPMLSILRMAGQDR